MTDSKRKSSEISALSPTNSETSTVIAPSPTNSETSTEIAFSPPPNVNTQRIIYRTASPIKRKRTSSTQETPTVALESPTVDDLPGYYGPFGTPSPDKRQHVYSPKSTKTKRRRTGGGIKRRRSKRKYTKKVL